VDAIGRSLLLRSLRQLLAARELNDLPDDAVLELSLAWRRRDPWPERLAALRRLRQRFVVAPDPVGLIRTPGRLAAVFAAEIVHAGF
jgi:2-haloacid dehalogenase